MSDQETATGEPSGAPVSDHETGEQVPLVCWICQQPIDPGEVDRWRAEPVHADCLKNGESE